MSSPTKAQFQSAGLTIAAELHSPDKGSPDRKGAAVIVSHPMTGVKEQTSSDYARALAKAGFYALTFDAAYQGESSGSPRGLENPTQRALDIKEAVSYLTTLKGKVDGQRIGLLGICASGGYTSYATQADLRIKALATVSAACVGRMTRNGGVDKDIENPDAIAGALKAAAEWRTAQAADAKAEAEAPPMFEPDPAKLPADSPTFWKDAAAYYGTQRGKHSRCNHKVPLSSYDLMVNYDSFGFQHLISPRPLLMIAGSNAQTLEHSKAAIGNAQEPKELFIIKGKNHFELYDDLSESGPKLVEFFGKALG
ncbi:hypothetical protein CDD82_6034 [Ophiocordyceps australis]|uniref:Dienelactone hydrolase domain-containing protein n=1 Tax=Ophiocordyceps australis TaxID=1399860 RepID=A0A2C5YXI1_9HYPO|nr:hypothetical protein CDD82_6034 [Ophiocordyceps australis]